MSIRAKLLSFILLISFIPVFIIGYLNYSNFKEIVEHQTQHNLELIALEKSQEIKLYLSLLEGRVKDFSSDGFIRDSLQSFQSVDNRESIVISAKQHLFENKMPLDEMIIAIDLLDQNNVAVISTSDNRLGIQHSEILDGQTSSAGVIFSDLFFDKDKDVLTIEVLAPVFSRMDKGKRVGSLLIRFDASKLNRLVFHHYTKMMMHGEMSNALLETDETYLVNAERLMITKSRFVDKPPLSITVDTIPVNKCLNEGQSMGGYWSDYRGVNVAGSSLCIDASGLRWVLLSEMDFSDAFALVNDYRKLFGLLMLLVLLLVVAVALYITRIVSEPIKILNEGAKKIASGNLSFTVGTEKKDEIGELSRSFDLMLMGIKRSNHEIENANLDISKSNQELSYVKEAMDRHAIIVETDRFGVITRVNQKFCDITQFEAEEIIGKTHQIINSGYHSRQFFENMWQVISSGKVWSGEICNRRKDGGIYWVSTTIVPYLNRHGEIERYIALRTDITRQKEIEENLLRLNGGLLSSANIQKAILEADDEAGLLNAACRVLVMDGGYSHAWIGYVEHDEAKTIKPVSQFGYGDDYLDSVKLSWGENELGNGPAGNAVRKGDAVVIRNISESKEMAPWYEYVSSLGTKGLVSLPLFDDEDVFAVVSLHTQQKNVFDVEEVALLKRLADDIAYGVMGIRSRCDQARAEAELEKSEENLRRAQQIAHVGSWQWDVLSDKHTWSDEQFRILGYQPGEISPSLDSFLKSVVISERDQVAAEIKQSIEAGVSRSIEFSITKVDGELRQVMTQFAVYMDGNGRVNRVIGTLLDLTDKKRAEENHQALQNQLQHAQKLDSIGQLTGGVAHDFNNILSSIMGYTTLAIEECPENNPDFLEYLDEVAKAGIRAKELISQLMDFSRRETKEAELLSLTELVVDTLNMLKPAIPAAVELNNELDDELPLVRVNEVQIHQIVTNLIINAADSIKDFGKVDVHLHIKQIKDCICTSCQQSFSGEFIELSVTDTGEGIAEQDIIRMFEPFFTTKKQGKGTGMGLAMVHGLLHSHDGHIQVESQLGQGSRFSLFFPCDNSAVESARPVIDVPAKVDGNKSGTILVVDDELQISQLLCTLLTRRGYQCVESNSPDHALQLFEAEPEKFDLVVTDQMMPKMTGMEMAALMLARRPELPVVLCTGYSGKINNADVEGAGLKGLIDKPINLEQMMNVVDAQIS